MATGKTRALMILTGIVCLVVAGWIGVEKLVAKEKPETSDSKVQIGKSQQFEKIATKKDSKPRSLEELNAILAGAKAEWEHLKDERFFFEDYADEVVSQFSLNEIELLGRERLGQDFRNVVGFHYAIMRRWGELDYEGAREDIGASYRSFSLAMEKAQFLRHLSMSEKDRELLGEPSISNEAKNVEPLVYSPDEMKALRNLAIRESWPGVKTDFPRIFYRNLLEELDIGRIRSDPKEFIESAIASLKELREAGKYDSNLSSAWEPRHLEEALRVLTMNFPQAARDLLGDNSRLVNLSPKRMEIGDKEEPLEPDLEPLMSGHFRGLSNDTDWLSHFDSMEPAHQRASLVPMLSRWMNDDPEAASAWVLANSTVTNLYELEKDPFATDEITSLPDKAINKQDYVLGEASGDWFRMDPGGALNWVSENRNHLSPDFYVGILWKMRRHDSPVGFLKILEQVEKTEDSMQNGEVVLLYERQINDFNSSMPYYYEWRWEVRILEALQRMDVAPVYRADFDSVVEEFESSIKSRDEYLNE